MKVNQIETESEIEKPCENIIEKIYKKIAKIFTYQRLKLDDIKIRAWRRLKLISTIIFVWKRVATACFFLRSLYIRERNVDYSAS